MVRKSIRILLTIVCIFSIIVSNISSTYAASAEQAVMLYKGVNWEKVKKEIAKTQKEYDAYEKQFIELRRTEMENLTSSLSLLNYQEELANLSKEMSKASMMSTRKRDKVRVEGYSMDVKDIYKLLSEADNYDFLYNEAYKKFKDLVKPEVTPYVKGSKEKAEKEMEKKLDALIELNKKPRTDQAYIKVPVIGAKKLSSGFGPRTHPVTGEKGRMHYGNDYPVPEGSKVIAPYAGVVSEVGYLTTGGYYVKLYHKHGLHTRYLHLSKALVNTGDVVKEGDVIALSGNTGAYTTGAHLHFEVMVDGIFVNPSKIIRGFR